MKQKIDWSTQRKRTSDKRMNGLLRLTRHPAFPKMHCYYDPKGRRIDLLRFGKMMEIRKFRVVKHTMTQGEHLVSTLWQGLDMNGIGWHYKVPPMIFETMVLCYHDGNDEKRMRNYQRMLAAGRDELMGRKFDVEKFGREYEPIECDMNTYGYRSHNRKHALKTHNRTVEAVRRFEKEKRNAS